VARQIVDQQSRPKTDSAVLNELQALRSELSALRRIFDEFAGTLLNARFPYGKPTDRWARR
jgi:hypothetical protein